MNKNKKNILLGLLFIGLGLLLFLSSSGILAKGVWRYLLSFTLLVAAVAWILRKEFFLGMYALVLVLRYFPGKLPHFLMNTSTFTMFVVATLFALGLSFIFGTPYSTQPFTKHSSKENLSGSHIKAKSSFNNASKYVYSDNLQSADLRCSLGSMNVFFNDVELHNDVQINVDCSLGSIELYFPKEWMVRENIKVTFGDVRSIVNFGNSDYVVYINGSVSFGDIKINYV